MILKINGKKHTLPESWAEVPCKKREKILGLLMVIKPSEAKVHALKELLPISKAMFLNIKADDIAAMCAQMPFLTLDASAEPVQNFIEHKGTRYYFPKTDFENGTALEFLAMQSLYAQFTKAEYPLSISYMNQLAAVLVREMDKTTKKRIVLTEYDENTVKRIIKFKDLSLVHATMVLKYVQGVLGMVEKIGTKFGIFEEKQGQIEDRKEPNVNLFGWKSVFRSIAADGPYAGGYDEVLQRPFWEIIEILAERAALQSAMVSTQVSTQTVES